MDKLISCEAAKKAMARFIGYGPIDKDMVKRFEIALDKLPASDAAPAKYTEFVRPTKIGGRTWPFIYHCVVCGEVPLGISEKTKYCAFCGAPIKREYKGGSTENDD